MLALKPLAHDALARKALSYGARVEMDGKVVNAARAKVVVALRKPTIAAQPAPEVVAPPTPAPVVGVSPLLVAAAEAYMVGASANAKASEDIIKGIQEALNRPAPPAAPVTPCKWVFTMKRDTQGRLLTVEAEKH